MSTFSFCSLLMLVHDIRGSIQKSLSPAEFLKIVTDIRNKLLLFVHQCLHLHKHERKWGGLFDMHVNKIMKKLKYNLALIVFFWEATLHFMHKTLFLKISCSLNSDRVYLFLLTVFCFR